MTPNRVAVAVEKYGSQIPANYTGMLRSDLEKADDRCMDEFMFLPIKKKGVTLTLSLLLGHLGIDHFYLGNKKKGFSKLALFILTTICSNSGNATGPSVLFGIALGIWWFVDIFKNYKRTKYNNFYSLSAYLYNHPYKELPVGAAPTSTLHYTPTASTTVKPTAPIKPAATPKPAVKPASAAKTTAKPSAADVIQLPPSTAKYSPVKTAPAKKPVEQPAMSTNDAMSAYAKSTESKSAALSLDDLADLAAAKSTLDNNNTVTVSEAPAKKKVSDKIDLTFSNITVNTALAKDLGFEDFDEAKMGGVSRGR